MSNDPTPHGIMQLGTAFWGSKTLLSAVELGVFTELACQPLETKALKNGWAFTHGVHTISSMPSSHSACSIVTMADISIPLRLIFSSIVPNHRTLAAG